MRAVLRYYYFNTVHVADHAKYAKMCDDIRNSLGLRKPVHFEARERFDHKLQTTEHTITGRDQTGTILYADGRELYLWAEWFTMNKNIKQGYFLESEHE